MWIESAHADESDPARGMSERRVVATQERDLGFAQGQNRISLGQQGAMKGDEKTTADHDIRHSRRQEGPAEAQGAFDTRHGSGGRAASSENHYSRAGKPRAPKP